MVHAPSGQHGGKTRSGHRQSGPEACTYGGFASLWHRHQQQGHPHNSASFATNKMAKIDPVTMEITENALPDGARPRRMAIDANDRVYFTDFSEGRWAVLNWVLER